MVPGSAGGNLMQLLGGASQLQVEDRSSAQSSAGAAMNPPDGTPTSHPPQIIEHVECRLCCQPIDARASRCPFCHAPQQPPRRWTRRLTRAGIIALILTLAGTVVWLASSRAQLLAERLSLQSELEQRERRLIAAIEKQVPAYLAASRQATEETWVLCSSGTRMLSTIEGMEHGRLANIREALTGATKECPQL
jgi:hypothetical protein